MMFADDEEDDLSALFGEPITYVEPRRGRGRPRGSPNRRKTDGPKLNYSHTPDRAVTEAASNAMSGFGDEGTSIRLAQLAHGVSIPFLMSVFRKSGHVCKERLRAVTPIRYGKNGAMFYDLYEAANVLIDPKVDIGAYMKSVKVEDLPNHLQANYWATRERRMGVEERARDLWRTQDVREVLGDLFKVIRNRVQLFGDSMNEASPLSPDHRAVVRTLLDGLMGEIREDLADNMKKRQTPSYISEIDDD